MRNPRSVGRRGRGGALARMCSLGLFGLGLFGLGLLGAGCGDDAAAGGDATAGGDASGPCAAPATRAAPTIPGDIGIQTASSIRNFRPWSMVGNALTPGTDTVTFRVVAPPGAACLDAWVDGEYQGRYAVTGVQQDLAIPVGGVAAGDHVLHLAAAPEGPAFAALTFHRTHPYYVLVTNDWDDALQEPAYRTLEETLHANHPAMKVTHFVGPYTFTDEAVSATEMQTSVDWLLGMQATYGDEIGLHLHPYCNFVETTTVPCRTAPSVAYAADDPTGYTVVLGSYTEVEAAALFAQAKALFAAHGLGTPTSFRAGAWTTELHTLKALASEGFVVDTSAVNWARMEEWLGQPGASLYEWNQAHWGPMDEYSQPYYPSASDVLAATPPVVPILEVPDNGILVDYVTDAEIIEMFEALWPGGALAAPTTYVTGYHPGSFGRYARYLEDGLAHIDGFLFENGDGPVVYETVSNMALVWPVP